MKRRLILTMSICVLLFSNVAKSDIKYAGSTLWTDAKTEDIYVSGKYIFTANGGSGIFITDYTDPANPKTLLNITFDEYLNEDIFYYQVNSVFVLGSCLYSVISLHEYDCGTWPNIVCIDITNIEKPEKLGTCKVDESCGGSSAYSIYVKYNLAFIPFIDSPFDSSGLTIIDVENPNNPVPVSKLNVKGRPLDILVQGDYAYIANGESAFEIIDISDPANPYINSRMDVEGNPYSIAKKDSFVFLAAGYSIELINVLNVKDATILKLFESSDFSKTLSYSIYIESLDISDNFLFVSLNSFGNMNEPSYLSKIDISDPLKPKDIERYKVKNAMEKIAVNEDHIILGTESSLIILEDD